MQERHHCAGSFSESLVLDSTQRALMMNLRYSALFAALSDDERGRFCRTSCVASSHNWASYCMPTGSRIRGHPCLQPPLLSSSGLWCVSHTESREESDDSPPIPRHNGAENTLALTCVTQGATGRVTGDIIEGSP